MIASLNVPPWMAWTAIGLAVAAGLALVLSWLRRPAIRPVDDAPLTVQPLSVLASTGGSSAKTPSLHMPKFMPPPAPVAPPPAEGDGEHRAAYRRLGNAVMVLVAKDDDHRRPLNAWVIDRSRHGLRLAAEVELRTGAAYSVRPAQAPPATPWLPVEVRHCAAMDGHWEVGCRFTQQPPIQTLMLFG